MDGAEGIRQGSRRCRPRAEQADDGIIPRHDRKPSPVETSADVIPRNEDVEFDDSDDEGEEGAGEDGVDADEEEDEEDE